MSSETEHHDSGPPVAQPPPGPGSGEQPEDANAPMVFVIGVVFTLFVFVVIIGLMALFSRTEQEELQRKVAEQRYEELDLLRAQQQERLGAYAWIDSSQGVVGIPIDRAMELARKRLSEGGLIGFEQLGQAEPTPRPQAVAPGSAVAEQRPETTD